MTKLDRWSILLLLIIVAAFGCRSAKTIQTAISKKDSAGYILVDSLDRADSTRFLRQVHGGLETNYIDFQTFSAKVKIDFQGSDGKKNDFNAFIRMRKDSVIWVSVNAMLGIEAFRILVTPDSVKVLNKLDKLVQLRSVSYLQEISKLPFTFTELQDLIIGNPIYFNRNILSFKYEGESLSVLSVGELFKHLLTMNSKDYVILYSKLDDVDVVRARTASILYGDYETKNNKPFSTFRKISVTEKSKLDIEMKFKQYDFNVSLNYPFSIPKNYKLQ